MATGLRQLSIHAALTAIQVQPVVRLTLIAASALKLARIGTLQPCACGDLAPSGSLGCCATA
jgi:hypothetical protein